MKISCLPLNCTSKHKQYRNFNTFKTKLNMKTHNLNKQSPKLTPNFSLSLSTTRSSKLRLDNLPSIRFTPIFTPKKIKQKTQAPRNTNIKPNPCNIMIYKIPGTGRNTSLDRKETRRAPKEHSILAKSSRTKNSKETSFYTAKLRTIPLGKP